MIYFSRMKCLVLLFASLACASAQVFSVESGLYTPEWIQDQAFDDLDVYYEEAFQDDFYPVEYPEGGDDGVGEPPVPQPPTNDPPKPPGRPCSRFHTPVVAPGCLIGTGKNPFCKPGLSCFRNTHPICNCWLIESCLYTNQPPRTCAWLAKLSGASALPSG